MNTKLYIEPWTKLMQVRNLEMKLHQLPRNPSMVVTILTAGNRDIPLREILH